MEVYALGKTVWNLRPHSSRGTAFPFIASAADGKHALGVEGRGSNPSILCSVFKKNMFIVSHLAGFYNLEVDGTVYSVHACH